MTPKINIDATAEVDLSKLIASLWERLWFSFKRIGKSGKTVIGELLNMTCAFCRNISVKPVCA